MRIAVFFSLMLFALLIQAQGDFERDEIAQRLKPVGQVHLEDNSTQAKALPTEAPKTPENPGQLTYEHYCVVCHGSGIAGAPKFRDKADWEPRFLKVNHKISDLVPIAMKGMNAMPPKGTCAECTEADIEAAIRYMVPSS